MYKNICNCVTANCLKQKGDNPYRVDEYYLIQDSNTLKSLTVGWCHPYISLGMSSGSGCIVSSNKDMNQW